MKVCIEKWEESSEVRGLFGSLVSCGLLELLSVWVTFNGSFALLGWLWISAFKVDDLNLEDQISVWLDLLSAFCTVAHVPGAVDDGFLSFLKPAQSSTETRENFTFFGGELSIRSFLIDCAIQGFFDNTEFDRDVLRHFGSSALIYFFHGELDLGLGYLFHVFNLDPDLNCGVRWDSISFFVTECIVWWAGEDG